MLNVYKKTKKFLAKVNDDHVSAYAAQSAFFVMLSLVPMILLLLMLIQYTPVTESDIIEVAYDFFPKTFRTTIVALIDETYSHTGTTISVTAFVVIWSAGKGVMAITNGLNTIQNLDETRNYIILRVRAAIYTFMFITAVVVGLLFWSFGTNAIITILGVVGILICIYRFLPNKRTEWKYLVPGAAFAAFGWMLASFVFSVYMDIFKGFSNMYGSLTTIVLLMLWLYFCMYVLLLGGEINQLIEEYLDNRHYSS